MRLLNNHSKKGGGGMQKAIGGGVSQKVLLQDFEAHMGVTAIKAACLLNSRYNTYKEWKGDRRRMTGPTLKLVEVLMALKGTGFGKQFGV